MNLRKIIIVNKYMRMDTVKEGQSNNNSNKRMTKKKKREEESDDMLFDLDN